MRTLPSDVHGPGTRLEREKAYWDHVYEGQGGGDRNHAWMEYVEATTFSSRFFRGLLQPPGRRPVLSIGGGVDRLGIDLAKSGHEVVCVDVSPAAAVRTEALARQAGVADRLTAVAVGCEEMTFPPGTFDAVVCRRALHHMDVGKVVPAIRDVLTGGGVFLAEEPVCLHRLVRWVHDRFPFYGDAPHTPDERELTAADLALVRGAFRSTRLYHFDLLARESVAYRLRRRRWDRLLYLLGKADYYLANRVAPPLRRFCNYVVIRSVK